MAELGIKDIANSYVGSHKRKIISGGERKRTAIGVEIVSNPNLLILDEPTSGLDSFMAS
jgi:ABC-type multidrug transport system ATPase subunit